MGCGVSHKGKSSLEDAHVDESTPSAQGATSPETGSAPLGEESNGDNGDNSQSSPSARSSKRRIPAMRSPDAVVDRELLEVEQVELSGDWKTAFEKYSDLASDETQVLSTRNYANVKLGIALLFGFNSVKINYKKAFEHFQAAGNAGFPWISFCYAGGIGVVHNSDQAMRIAVLAGQHPLAYATRALLVLTEKFNITGRLSVHSKGSFELSNVIEDSPSVSVKMDVDDEKAQGVATQRPKLPAASSSSSSNNLIDSPTPNPLQHRSVRSRPRLGHHMRKRASSAKEGVRASVSVRLDEDGESVDTLLSKTYVELQELCLKGHGWAKSFLGLLINDGLMKDQGMDSDAGVTLLSEAADLGHAYAQYAVGLCRFNELLQSDANPSQIKHTHAADVAYIVSWYEKAANQGLPDAISGLSKLYADGDFVDLDDDKALSYVFLGAEAHDEDMMVQLGKAYLTGQAYSSVTKNYDKAMQLLKSAAAMDNAEATFLLGEMYGNGMGVQSNRHTADTYFQKADTLGY